MNWAAIIWLILLVLFCVVEASTVAMVSLWFAAGCLVAMIASFLNAPVWLQLLLFFAVSGISLAALRPLARKFLTPRITKTNTDAVIGTTGLVTVAVDNITAEGQVKLGAMVWTARSTSGDPIPEGTLIRVDRFEGVMVFVTPAGTAVASGL